MAVFTLLVRNVGYLMHCTECYVSKRQIKDLSLPVHVVYIKTFVEFYISHELERTMR